MDADAIVIGSSPISLMEALYLAKKGLQVLIVDCRSKPGGAWGEIDVHGQSVEIGCHIWDESSVAKTFLEDDLGVSLQKLKPRPVVVWKGKKLPYHWKNNIILANTLIRHPARIRRTLKKVKPALFANDFYYPESGSAQLVQKLIESLNTFNVEWVLNREVQLLEITETGVSCQTAQETYTTEQVVVSLYASPEQVLVGGAMHKNANTPLDYSHYHLILDDAEPSGLSYCRVYGHPFIHRISDLSAFTESSKKVLAVGVFHHKLPAGSQEEHVKQLLDYARGFGWASQNATLSSWGFNNYSTKKIGVDQYHALENSPKATVLNTMNFSHGVAAYASKWRT